MQQLLLELAPPPAPTLENFSPGKNGAALKALRHALEGGEGFVFLWGPGGSGKTHLLRAFSRAAAAAKRDAITADDVGRLGESEQVALFDQCNRLRASGGALAASGDAPPAQLPLRPDLRSRLASGIVLQLHPLGDGDKAAALSGHAAGRGIALEPGLIAYLLSHFDRDMGTQIAMLDALDRYSLQRKRPVTLPLLKEALRLVEQPEARPLMADSQAIALFDLDNTLLSGDSDYEWAQFLIERGVLDRSQYESRNDHFFRQYKEGRLDIHEFLDFQLAPLARHPRDDLDRWHAEFMRTRIRPIVRAKGRDLVRRHVDQGDLCAIVTSTNAFITAPIARELGIDHLLATELEERGGRFTGRPSGTPSFRMGKVTRLAEWLGGRGQTLASFSASWFYSDSHNDLPLLERVTRPVAVDPDDVLRGEALTRGWQIISLQ